MTARDYLEEWLMEQELFLRCSTWEALTIYVRKHLAPYFDVTEVSDITPAMCQQYARDKLRNGRADGKGGLSPVSVRKHVSILKRALGDAVLLGLIPTNPAQYVRLPRSDGAVTPRTVFLTPEEARAVIEAFEGHSLYPAVVLALYYGLRRSEILGLRWQAVDFRLDKLTVSHTVVKNLTIQAKDTTKTKASRRAFQLLPEVREMLLELKKRGQKSEYILHRENGSPLRPDSLTRGFQRVLKRNGFAPMRFHDLRHSTASILFDRGWSVEDVKEWLGHSDIETTSNIYLHYRSQRKTLLAHDLEGMLIAKKKSPD